MSFLAAQVRNQRKYVRIHTHVTFWNRNPQITVEGIRIQSIVLAVVAMLDVPAIVMEEI